jgi:hypothetical protein
MAKDEATTGEKAEPNVLKDRLGDERPWDPEKYPDDSPAKKGHITKPSGQGGANPKSRPDHQDMFPQNPPPSETAKAKGEENDRLMRGEVSPVNPDRAYEREAKEAVKAETNPDDQAAAKAAAETSKRSANR